MKLSRMVALVTAFLAAACSHPGLDLGQGPRHYKSSDYEKVLGRWTRSGRVFDHFDTNLKVTATYFSWDFTTAYAIRWAKMFRMPKVEAIEFRHKLLADKTRSNEFYLAVTTQELRWNDLDHKDSIWHIRLVTDRGDALPPITVERILPITASQRAMFPYTKTFYYAYKVRFSAFLSGRKVLDPGIRWFGLRFAGPKGVVTLKWKTRQ